MQKDRLFAHAQGDGFRDLLLFFAEADFVHDRVDADLIRLFRRRLLHGRKERIRILLCASLVGDHSVGQFFASALSGLYIKPGEQRAEVQLRKEFKRFRRIEISDAGLLPVHLNIAVRLDRHEKETEPCQVFVFTELFSQRRLFDLLDMFVDAVHAPVIHDQLCGRLLSDPRHAGHIVRAVPHQGFHIDKRFGSHLVAVQYVRGVVILYDGLALLRLGDPDADAVRGDLQQVSVSRQKRHFHAFRFPALCQCSQYVVGLQSRLLADLYAHGLQDFFDQGDLLPELFGHGLSRPLVFLVSLMPEGWRMHVKSDGQIVRLLLVQNLKKNI